MNALRNVPSWQGNPVQGKEVEGVVEGQEMLKVLFAGLRVAKEWKTRKLGYLKRERQERRNEKQVVGAPHHGAMRILGIAPSRSIGSQDRKEKDPRKKKKENSNPFGGREKQRKTGKRSGVLFHEWKKRDSKCENQVIVV